MEKETVKEDMILINGFDSRYNQSYSIYLGVFPYKIYDSDFKFILDGAFEYMNNWVASLKWNPLSAKSHVITDFSKGSPLFITDINGEEHILTREKLIIGIKLALDLYGKIIVFRDNEIKTYSFTSELCDLIVQFSLYKTYKYINENK